MPLVRIDIKRNPDVSYAKKLGKVVYDSMKTAINVPDQDNFQVLSQDSLPQNLSKTTYADPNLASYIDDCSDSQDL